MFVMAKSVLDNNGNELVVSCFGERAGVSRVNLTVHDDNSGVIRVDRPGKSRPSAPLTKK